MKKAAFVILIFAGVVSAYDEGCAPILGIEKNGKSETWTNRADVLKSCGDREKALENVKEYAKNNGKKPENVFLAGEDESAFHFLILD